MMIKHNMDSGKLVLAFGTHCYHWGLDIFLFH